MPRANGKSSGPQIFFAMRSKNIYVVKKILGRSDPYKVVFEVPEKGYLPNLVYQCWQVFNIFLTFSIHLG